MIRATRPAPAVDASTASLAAPLRERAAVDPDRLAIVDGDVRLSYRELAARAESCARALRAHGVAPGDVLTMQLPNWWEAAVVYQAAMLAGCVLNPVVPIYRERELGFIERQCAPRVVVVPHRFRGFDFAAMHLAIASDLEEFPLVVVVRSEGPVADGGITFDALDGPGGRLEIEVDGDDICLLLYTSGTTADPKGVLHSHRTIAYEVDSIVELCRLGRDDHVFMPSPVTHITGYLYGLVMPAVTGSAAVFQDVWDPAEAVDLIERDECRFSVGATPFLHGLVEEYERRGHPSALTTFLCGGADVPPPLIRRAAEQFDAFVTRVYGSSEFPTATCGRPGDPFEITADTDGVPIGPVGCRLDDGELLLAGPDLFLGYLDASLNDASFTADGFFRTGDLATIDDAGAVTITGRKKDIILRGGENISAKEVEDLLFEHPAVHEVAVVAMPDPVMVERACAFVVVEPGATVTLPSLVAHLEQHRLARQKLPERLEVVDELPKTASGKVQKFLLRDRVAALLAREGALAGEPPSR
ncbi:MAG TPA: AMP-binding protein [Acidimicrobiales bacterium]|nr:AMP-binding protein [Acidimicrobiales bacterium]